MKKSFVWLTIILAGYLTGSSVLHYLNNEKVSTAYIMGSVVLIMLIIEMLTWGMDFRTQRDELGQKIAGKAATVSYYILIITMFLLWIIDRVVFVRTGDFGNITLFFLLCFTMILYPFVSFVVSRRYR